MNRVYCDVIDSANVGRNRRTPHRHDVGAQRRRRRRGLGRDLHRQAVWARLHRVPERKVVGGTLFPLPGTGRWRPLGGPVEIREGSVIATSKAEWKLVTQTQTLNRCAPLEAAILESPDDEGAWRVYCDWLLEHADPLMIDDRELVAPWLEVLGERGGFITAARVRGGFCAMPERIEEGLRWLQQLPQARFLDRLELNPLWVEPEAPSAALEQVVLAFERVSLSIRHLTLGPFWHGALPDFARLASAGGGCPDSWPDQVTA
ncbi:MAG: hypothetical protein JNK82_28370 [Myxococcaceae bacterium]|nr:hypothetical protein [Myxococcaceae bacterium]